MARLGISVGGPLGAIGPAAAACEAAGFDSLWVSETARTAFLQAAVAVQGTDRIRVGTSIALAFPRSPVITAMEARDLAELSGGRFVLGLGTQVKRVNELRFATPFEHPAPRMREVVEVCRKVWRAFFGEPIDHRGRFFTVTMGPFPGGRPPPGPIPVYLAAVNRAMLRLTGEVADGLLGHPFTSTKYIEEVVRPTLDEGIAAAARTPGDVELAQSVIVSIADRTEDALRGAKMQIAFYATTRTYAPVLDVHGWGDVVGPLREAHARGDADGMIALITDEMADTYSASGTPDEVRDKLRRYDGLADTIIVNPPWVTPDLTRSGEAYLRIVEALGARRP